MPPTLISRRAALRLSGLAAATLLCGAPGAAQAAKSADLLERLETGLKARRPTEFAFLARVVRLVERGRLPRGLVNGTYLWAIAQPNHRFQHFQQAIRLRAKRLGIKL